MIEPHIVVSWGGKTKTQQPPIPLGRAKTQMQALAGGQFRGGTKDEWALPAIEVPSGK